MSDIASLLDAYLAARGLQRPSGASARKVAEEAIELVEACSGPADSRTVAHELADVVLAAAVVAEHYGFTVEDAIRQKIELDTDRELRAGS